MTTTRHILANGDFSQDWTNVGLIALNDDWSGVPSIVGYLGDGLTTSNDVDPRTYTGAINANVDVIANQSSTTINNGGVAEFDGIANPTIALNGSGTADAPSISIFLDASGRSDVRVRMNLRDLDASADNAAQQVAVQYRVGGGAWQTAVYFADVTTANAATQVTAVDVTLGSDANNAADLEVRVLTTNASGNDEWVGVDDILVTSQGAPVTAANVSINDVAIVEGNSGTTNLVFTVTRSNADGSFNVDFATADGTATAGSDYAATNGTLSFVAGGALSQTVSVTINGDTDAEANETLTVALSNLVSSLGTATIADASGTGTITNDDLGVALTAIYTIQGAGHTSAFVGQTVTTTGVVTAVDNNGFYLQDATGDGNIATSDAIFVFTSSAPTVAVGNAIQLTGTVSEFFPGGAATGNLSTTQLGSISGLSVLSVGNALPAAVILGAAGRQLPTANIDDDGLTSFDPTTDGIDFFESLEAMLVTVPTPRAVSSTNQFGEIYTVADNGANATGLSARGTIVTSGTTGDGLNVTNSGPGSDYNPERIQIDPDSTITPGTLPLVDVGAVLNDVTGVIGYNFGNFEVIPTAAITVATQSVLTRETTLLTGSDDVLTIATYNVLNLDPNDADGDTDIANGRFDAIALQLVNNLGSPDIIALQEVQDNSGSANDGTVSASVTLQTLVNAISDNGGPVYTFIDNTFITNNASGGQPGGNIRVAYLYNADRVSLVDGSVGTTPDAAVDFAGSRPPLIATFEFNDQEVTLVNNHFSSKGGGTPLYGTTQLSVNGSAADRLIQAQNVADYVDSLGPDANVVVLGDLNEFTNEESLAPLFAAGLADLGATLAPTERYSFVFDGNAQSLDQTFVSAGLTSVASYDIVHVNTEFAVTAASASDHDPSILALNLPEVTNVAYTLQLLHFADAEAGTLASTTAKYLAANVDAFEDDYANSITLAGGDNFIPGPFLAAGTDVSVRDELNALTGSTITSSVLPIGAVDIALHNLIGVQASTIGNHEFDLGSNVFRNSFTPNSGWVGADFPYLSANLDFSADTDLSTRFTTGGQEASAIKGRIAPTAIITEGGEKIGIVAVTTQILEAISSPSGTEVLGFPGGPGANGEVDNMVLLASQIQPLIDGLIASGVNKIVLMSHLQILNNERALAELISGVDIILAAGSNTRLGDADDVAVAFPGHSANFADTYPIVTAGTDGKTTVIVNTDNEFTYLGRLVVDFDANGHIIAESLTANVAINGAYASTAENVAAAWGDLDGDLTDSAFAAGTRGRNVEILTDAVQSVITVKDGNVFGWSDVYLNGERISVRNQETNLGNITADANADALRDALGAAAPQFIVSLKNGGGIRAQIGSVSAPDPIDGTVDLLGPGTVSQLDIENSLRFNNGLMAFDTTAAGLKAILEHGVAALGNQGRFPQIGGVAFSFDPDLAAGSRVLDISLIREDGSKIALFDNGVALGSAPATITVVTLNFLANGGDGYPIKANGENFRFLLNDGTLSAPVDEALSFTATGVVPLNILGEQQALGEYLTERFPTEESAFNEADTAIQDDTRIQNLNFRAADTVLPNFGTAGNDVLNGSEFADVFDGLAGNDTINGNGGNDILIGGLGADRLNGGAGVDTASYATATGGVAASLRTNGGTFGEALGDIFNGIENLTGSAFDDVLTGNVAVNTIDGGAGNDVIFGGGGLDVLFGGEGNDQFVFTGSQTYASINGGAGTDTIAAGATNTRLFGGSFTGIEVISANGFTGVTIQGGAASDTIDLRFSTLDGIGSVNGNNGNDIIAGTENSDVLNGGAGLDQLFGGGGDDFLRGNNGIDTISGGAGADTFIIATGETGRSIPNGDVYTDFLSSEGDKFDLSLIDANTTIAGDNAFTFIGKDIFSRTAGELRFEINTKNIFVFGDVNGDGSADFSFTILNTSSIAASDFIL